MRMTINVACTSDDGRTVRKTGSELQVTTDLDGVDPSVAKQEFLAQVETLMRTITEVQLPALYQSVEDQCREHAEEMPAQVRDKLQHLRNKKKADDAGAEAEPPSADVPDGQAEGDQQ